MGNKRIWGMLLLFVLLSFPVSASMVSFLLVETGISEDITGSQYTSLWEGGLMAAFFDAGHIVTNSPIMRLEKKPSKDLNGYIEDDFNEAIEAGAEYFILGFLEYQLQGSRPVPVDITLKVYTIKSKNKVYEQSFSVGRRSLNEEFQFAQDTGRNIVSHLAKR